MTLLFVYGTLMYGLQAHNLMAGTFFAGRGRVRGRLVICDGFPLLVYGADGVVWGELYHVPIYIKARIDEYEGASSLHSPWREIKVEVDVLGLRVQAVAYGVTSIEVARRLCDRLEEVNAEDYGLLVGRRYPRWLVISPHGDAPGIPLGTLDVSVNAMLRTDKWCLEEGFGEEVYTAYDTLATLDELREWARELGCRLAGVNARLVDGALEVYPLAPLA